MQTTPFIQTHLAQKFANHICMLFAHTNTHMTNVSLSICVRFLFTVVLSSQFVHTLSIYQLTEFYCFLFSFVFFLLISDCFYPCFSTKWSKKVHVKAANTHTHSKRENRQNSKEAFHSMQFTTMSSISVNKSTILCLMILCALLMAHVQSASINTTTTDLSEDRSFKSAPVGKYHFICNKSKLIHI